jgi:hypothetical protein
MAVNVTAMTKEIQRMAQTVSSVSVALTRFAQVLAGEDLPAPRIPQNNTPAKEAPKINSDKHCTVWLTFEPHDTKN